MSRGTKRARTGTSCHGEGCGQPDCSSCFPGPGLDDAGLLDIPGIHRKSGRPAGPGQSSFEVGGPAAGPPADATLDSILDGLPAKLPAHATLGAILDGRQAELPPETTMEEIFGGEAGVQVFLRSILGGSVQAPAAASLPAIPRPLGTPAPAPSARPMADGLDVQRRPGQSPSEFGGPSPYASLESGLGGPTANAYIRSVPGGNVQTPTAASSPAVSRPMGAIGQAPSARQMVDELDAQTLRDLVVDLAARSPLFTRTLSEAYAKHMASRPRPKPSPAFLAPAPAAPQRPAVPLAQMRPVLNFDSYSKTAWHALNNRALQRLSGSRQYDKAGEVWSEISECVEAIGARTMADSPLRTKISAVETLRKIAKTVILGEGTVGSEVRKELQDDSEIADIMVRVMESMIPEERVQTGKRRDEKGTLVDKVQWVVDEAEAYCLEGLDGLRSVVEMMKTGRCVVSLD